MSLSIFAVGPLRLLTFVTAVSAAQLPSARRSIVAMETLASPANNKRFWTSFYLKFVINIVIDPSRVGPVGSDWSGRIGSAPFASLAVNLPTNELTQSFRCRVRGQLVGDQSPPDHAATCGYANLHVRRRRLTFRVQR